MIVVEYHDIELDWCPECEGLWFDRGEMELVAAQARGSTSAPVPERKADTREKRLKCPECNKTMDKRLLGDEQPVIADVCPLCGGLWLDHGELEMIVSRHDSSGQAGPIIGHLQETFVQSEHGHAATPDGRIGNTQV